MPEGGSRIAVSLSDVARDGIRLGFLMHDVSRMRRNAYDQYMKSLRITRAQWWVLAHLSRCDGMMQKQLAELLDVGQPSLGDVVGGLEAGGWVERRQDQHDRRAKRVYLMPSARALIQRMARMEAEFNEKVFAALPPEERQALSDSLLKVRSAIASLSADR